MITLSQRMSPTRLASRPLWGFTRFLLQRMGALRVPQTAGSLTFTTLLALVPLLTITLTVISAFPVFSDYSVRFKTMLLSTLVPEFAGRVITVYMRQFADNAARLTAVGIVMLGVSALMLMATIERTFNAIWSVRRGRPWLQQSMVYWTVITLGPVALGGGLLLWRWVFRLMHIRGLPPWAGELAQSAGAVALTALVLTLLLRIVPNRYVPLRHAAWGAGVTAVLLELTKAGFGYYIGELASYQLVYGAFASGCTACGWCCWPARCSPRRCHTGKGGRGGGR